MDLIPQLRNGVEAFSALVLKSPKYSAIRKNEGVLQLLVAAGAALLVFGYSIYRPTQPKTNNYHSPSSKRYKKMRSKHFPPGFPNGWHCVCNTADVEKGKVKSISALGTHMVAFRGSDGKIGVLDAFCPHMGAHLGMGGVVVGSMLVCPFHGWSFDSLGNCRRIPYTTRMTDEIKEKTKTKAYETRVILGRVFIWFDAEGRPPQWNLEAARDLEESVANGSSYVVAMRVMNFEMHCCEMHMNSADPYHFNTLHAPLPVPGLSWFLKGVHKIKTVYGEGEVDGKLVQKPHLTLFNEKTLGLFFFGKRQWPVPLTAWASSLVDVVVTFEGPNMMHFKMHTPFGTIRQIKTILPIEPFKQQVESYWYADSSVPRLIAYLLSLMGKVALNQDRQVWENKIYRKAPILVENDGPFYDFFEWYAQFYSPSSEQLSHNSLEW